MRVRSPSAADQRRFARPQWTKEASQARPRHHGSTSVPGTGGEKTSKRRVDSCDIPGGYQTKALRNIAQIGSSVLAHDAHWISWQ